MRRDDPGQPSELDQADLRNAVTDQVAPPSTRGPDLLPFNERSWQDFEKIVLVVAEQVDGVRSVRPYGVPGQRQYGIDIYGTGDDGENVGYQAKRRVAFRVSELTAAVEEFAKGFRPVSATRLVICVSCDTDRTEMSEMLEQLREQHDFGIELFDRRSLSEKLRTRPELVRQLFGPEWETAFCNRVDWPVPVRTSTDVLADALVRGPITALGLEADFNHCNALAATDPGTAAADLAAIIEALSEKGFAGFAERLRLQHAELLVRAGDLESAARVLSRLAWEQIESGGGNWDPQATGRLRALTREADLPEASAFVAFADAIGAWYGQPARDLGSMIDLYQRLSDAGNPDADAVILWVLETAIATGENIQAAHLAAQVDSLVERRGALGPDNPITVRLRTAKADLSGEWVALLRDARAGRLGHAMATLVHARCGRYTVGHARPEEGDSLYYEAIQRACTAGLTAEAAAALRSIVHLRSRFGPLSEDMNVLSQLAFSLESSGAVGLLPGGDPQDAGAAALARNDLPGALRWYRTALRNAVIRGDLNDEHGAHVALVEVLVRAGERSAALGHALAAGRDAEKCLPLSGYFDVRERINDGPYWERATGLHLASLQADLIPDDDVADYVNLALTATQEPRRSFFAPHVDLNAWKSLASLIERTTAVQAKTALELLEERIAREPNHYRHEDDEHLQIVVGIARAHSALEARAVGHLARIIEQGDHFGYQARSEILRRLNPPPSILIDHLNVLADAGNGIALQTLGDLGVAHPDLVATVQEAVDSVLNAPEPPPGTFSFGTGLPQVAYRARILEEDQRQRMADHCLTLALNIGRPEQNRTEGIEGVGALARHLNDGLRKEFFRRSIDLARPAKTPTEVDKQFLGGLHPLSTMRVDLDFGSLPREALQAAAALALTRDDAGQVVTLAMERLMSTKKEDAHAGAHAIATLNPEHVDLDVQILLTHPAVWVRQLAALLAIHRAPSPTAAIMELASDPDPDVRRTLATGLGILRRQNPELAEQIGKILCTDAHWSVRHLASKHEAAVRSEAGCTI